MSSFPTPPGIDPRDPDYVVNPATGERFLFHTRADDPWTGPLAFDIWAPPGMAALKEHVHPKQEESFTVRRGTMELSKDGRVEEHAAGSAVAIPAGTPHSWRTKGDEELHVTVRLEPGRSFEDFARDLAALAERGAVGKDGAPSLLQLAVMWRAYPDEIYLASPPVWVQKAVFTVLSPVATLMGYRAGRPSAA